MYDGAGGLDPVSARDEALVPVLDLPFPDVAR
jgi:hypothetical protein